MNENYYIEHTKMIKIIKYSTKNIIKISLRSKIIINSKYNKMNNKNNIIN